MLIGILSDIHDNIWALDDALEELSACDALLCLGDLCAPFTMAAIGKGFAGPVYTAWGNNDGDKVHISRQADNHEHVQIKGDVCFVELGGRRIAMTHYPELAEALAQGGQYDLVCHGHDHERRIVQGEKTVLLNPGEVMGRFGVRSVAVYDTEEGKARLIEF